MDCENRHTLVGFTQRVWALTADLWGCNPWSHQDYQARFFTAVADEPDLDHLMADHRLVQTQQQGATKKTTRPSQGGPNTKLHTTTEHWVI